MDSDDSSEEQDWAAPSKEKKLEKWQCLEEEKPEEKLQEAATKPEEKLQEEKEGQRWNWIVKYGGSGAWPTQTKADSQQEQRRPLQRKAEPAKGETGMSKLMSVPGVGSTGPAMSLLEVKRALSGTWEGDRSETYSVNLKKDDNWMCTRHDGEGGEKPFPLYWDEEACCVWWGENLFSGRPGVAGKWRCCELASNSCKVKKEFCLAPNLRVGV